MTSTQLLQSAMVASFLAVCTLARSAPAEVGQAPRLIRSDFYDPSTTASITLGSTLEQVRQAFGLLPHELVSSDSTEMLLNYSGFTVRLEQFPGSSEFRTVSIELGAPGVWFTPGLAVGMSAKSLKLLLGRPDLTAVDAGSGEKILHYSISSPPADLRIQLWHGKVVNIRLLDRDWPHAG